MKADTKHRECRIEPGLLAQLIKEKRSKRSPPFCTCGLYSASRAKVIRHDCTDPTAKKRMFQQPPKLEAWQVQKAVAMRGQGLTYREIAQRFDVSHEAVRQHIKRWKPELSPGQAP